MAQHQRGKTGGGQAAGQRQKRGGRGAAPHAGAWKGAALQFGQEASWWDYRTSPASNSGPKRINVAGLFAAAEAVERAQGAHPTPDVLPETFLGKWVDSLGNTVSVYNTDAFETKLVATLSRPPRHDIHLAVRRRSQGDGWQCGNAVLDLLWSSQKQLHWLTANGRVSVWVRESDADDGMPKDDAENPSGTDPVVSNDDAAVIDTQTGTEATTLQAPVSAEPLEAPESGP